MIDPATALAFSMFENRGVYALLLGSGVSRSAHIPTGWEIVLQLTARVAALEGVADQADWVAWHQERFGEPPNYSRLLDKLAQTAEERRAILHRLIEPTPADLEEGRKTPTRAHRAIARLVRDGFLRVIVTTNFDRLMENALREVGVEPTVVKSEDDLRGATPLIHTRCFILKVHGDYLDTRLRNTEGELGAYSPALDACLDRIFDEHGLVICGWSADWDEALRAAISRAPNRRFSLFWAARGRPSETALDLIRQRGGRTIPIDDADSFFDALQQRVEVQSSISRTHPLSVDLLVATAKRYLARPEHRIQLADLVWGEVKRVQALAMSEGLTPAGTWSPEEFRRRVAAYEALYEPLLRVAFALGRWGDGTELPMAAELLQALAVEPEGGGVVSFLRLSTYPGVLIFTAYGLGAAQAGRLKALKAWFDVPLRKGRRTTTASASETLFLQFWDGGEKQLWQNLEGLEKRLAPLSDHLFEVFAQTCQGEFLTLSDLEFAFEWYEILAALHLIALRIDRDTLELTLGGKSGQRDYVYTPLGRAGWDSKNWELLLERIVRPDSQKALLESGFANGDVRFLGLMAQNIRKSIDHFNW